MKKVTFRGIANSFFHINKISQFLCLYLYPKVLQTPHTWAVLVHGCTCRVCDARPVTVVSLQNAVLARAISNSFSVQTNQIKI